MRSDPGHPPTGFFFSNDFRTASCHFPSILRVPGFGPGTALDFLDFFVALRMEWRPLAG